MNKMILNLEAFISGYVEALLFAESAIDQDGETVESLAGYDLSPTAMDAARQDCARFLDTAGRLIKQAIEESQDYDYIQAGRDLWFTRQGHGVGYWDRDLGDVGDTLSRIARKWGERYISINENNQLEVE